MIEFTFYGGCTAMLCAVLCLCLAVRQARKESLRSVIDDLSGRKRQRGIEAEVQRSNAPSALRQTLRAYAQPLVRVDLPAQSAQPPVDQIATQAVDHADAVLTVACGLEGEGTDDEA